MSGALKLASFASGLTLLSASAYHTYSNPSKDFSRNAQALEHTLDSQQTADGAVAPKPKLPSNFVSFTIGGYEFKNAA